ncbi:MAG: arylsulfatase, partial [Planctomycetaceae bacterium]
MKLKISWLAILISLFLVPTSHARSAFEPRPNFVVIFCDNLGYGDIEPFGSKVHRTPHLNRMAREGC